MLVLNLACEAGHGFEGWFGSSADFESQQQRGLLSCPMCNSVQVRRMPSAPRLNLSSATEPVAPSRGGAGGGSGSGAAGGHGAAGGAGGRGAGGGGGTLPGPSGAAPGSPADGEGASIDLQRQVLQAVRQIMANTEDVGERFAEEARRIHYGESEARGIRGQATPDEAQALAEEGIEVVTLAVPSALKDPLQ